MSQLHPYMQSVPNYQGPLYQYLHHQQQPPMYHNYMYNQEHGGGHSQQKRYWMIVCLTAIRIWKYIVLLVDAIK